MKTWFLLAGLLILGSLALFGGSHWFSADDVPGEEDVLQSVRDLSAEDSQKTAAAPVPKAQLELNLPVGEPVSLLKTVEQVLIQKTPEGERTSRSSLELAVTLRLEEKADDGSRRLSVAYDRVRYRQNLAGRSFVFDSTVPSGPLPVGALPYKGLAGNGFSFWIGKDHRLLQPVGFADFLKRCLREVPPAQQRSVLMAFVEAAEEGVTDFVDDSLGFLPPTPSVGVNDAWNHERRLAGPVPLVLSTRCTLKRLTGQFAEIDLEGTITPVKPPAASDRPGGDFKVIVRGGHSQGHCEIDRKTGLPAYGEIKRRIDMEVRLADGRHFDQQKTTTTTIRLSPQPESSEPESHVIPASAEFPAR